MPDETPRLPRLLQELDAETARQIAPLLRGEDCVRGQTILAEGDTPTALYFVEHGLARLVQLSLEGRVFVLGYVGPGECLNLASALEARPLAATVEAMNDTRLWVLAAERWGALLQAQPRLYRAVALQLTRELHALADLVRELALHPVGARLARFLIEHSDGAAAPAQHWTQESIAASIGSVRDVVGRALRGLMDEGILRKERGRLLIVDRPALERISRGE
jgi:CRP/FNR family transcriptional regulator